MFSLYKQSECNSESEEAHRMRLSSKNFSIIEEALESGGTGFHPLERPTAEATWGPAGDLVTSEPPPLTPHGAHYCGGRCATEDKWFPQRKTKAVIRRGSEATCMIQERFFMDIMTARMADSNEETYRRGARVLLSVMT